MSKKASVLGKETQISDVFVLCCDVSCDVFVLCCAAGYTVLRSLTPTAS